MKIITIILILFCMFYVIPSFFTPITNYNYEIKTLKSTKYISIKKTKNRIKNKLVLIMNDDTNYSLDDEYSDYFFLLSDKKNIGKKYKLYLDYSNSPVQIEIEGKIIFDNTFFLIGQCLFLIFTIILSFLYIPDMWNSLKKIMKKVR